MTVPRLGFGTAPILGRLGRKDSLRALSLAYDLGVRHFDTARSYGWGEAESVLGQFLAGGRRQHSTVVTKCGILPVRRSPLLSFAKAGARNLARLAPATRSFVRRAASTTAFSPKRSYDTVLLRASLETSLAQLRTDHVDVLLLHSYAPEQDGLEEVCDLFLRLQREGKLRRYGFSIEGSLQDGLAHLSAKGALTGAVVQAPLSRQLLDLPEAWRTTPLIAHSPFRSQGEVASPRSTLRGAIRSLAVHTACEALVTSMFSPAHIEANVRDHALMGAAALQSS